MPGFSYDPRSKTAHFDVDVHGGKGRVRRRRTVAALNAQDAKRLWAAFCDEVNGDATRRADTRTLTFGAFFERHFEEVCEDLAPKTKRDYAPIVRTVLLKPVAATPMNEIRAREVNAVAVKLKKEGRAGATVNGYIAVLLALLRKAVEHDFLDEYPLRKKVIRYKVNKPEKSCRTRSGCASWQPSTTRRRSGRESERPARRGRSRPAPGSARRAASAAAGTRRAMRRARIELWTDIEGEVRPVR